VRLSHKSETAQTAAEFGNSRRFLRQSHFCETVWTGLNNRFLRYLRYHSRCHRWFILLLTVSFELPGKIKQRFINIFSDVKSSRGSGGGQNFGIGLGLEALASASAVATTKQKVTGP